jgi:plastocyanin
MRTVAMTVVCFGCAAMAAGWAYFLIFLVLPATDKNLVAVLAPLSLAFVVMFGVLGAVGGCWPGTRTRAGFWLGAAVVGLLAVLLNAPYIPVALANPADTNSFLVTVVVVAAGAAILVGGIAAFLDVRRGRPTWSRDGRTGLVVAAVVAGVVGAAATSVLAGSASAGGGRVTAAPTMTGLITAQNTTFLEASLSVKNGEVLGVFVINKDATGHAFDIDSLGIHVQLAPNSTTAIAVTPTGPGALEFYCSIPGHREAGMVGTIAVE